MSTPAHHLKDVLQQETDARFWAQTGYRVGQKLDPQSAADRAMVPLWLDLYRKVKAEDDRGDLRLTYNHPVVEEHLDHAATATAAATGHAEAATKTDDPWASGAHAAAASEATRAAATAAGRAAALQPPGVSTFLADLAAAGLAAVSGAIHHTILDRLAPDHPALTSPAAQPAQPHPEEPPPPVPDTPPAPPTTAADHLAAAQVQLAPDVAASVHAADAERGARGDPTPLAVLHPQTIAGIRRNAQKFAADSDGAAVGVAYLADNSWSVPKFGGLEEAAAWYAQIANAPDSFRYLAYFSRADGASWPGPVNEVFGSSRGLGILRMSAGPAAALATAASTAPSKRPDADGKKKTSYGTIALIGLVAASGAVAIAAERRRRRYPR